LKTLAIVAAALIGLAVLLMAWLYYRAVVGGRRAYLALAQRVEPVTQALVNGESPSSTLLLRFAEDRETRKVLFDTLESFDKTALFPEKFRTWELMAEADLVAWLCHPNELGTPPSDIELVTRVSEPDAPSDTSVYFVFRFRTCEPHWAAKDGWLTGVVGPCDTTAPAAPYAAGTFSRFEPIDSRTAAEHVAVAHAALHGTKSTTLRAAS
jgi:hypothetical protein